MRRTRETRRPVAVGGLRSQRGGHRAHRGAAVLRRACWTLALAGLGASCTCEQPDRVSGDQPSGTGPRDALVVAVKQDFSGFTADTVRTGPDTDVLALLHLRPMRATFDCRPRYEPRLAEDWRFSEDGRTLTLTLRDDIRWSDGVPVTAQDVAFTYDRIRGARGSVYASYTDHMDPEADPRVVNDHEVAFRFVDPLDRNTLLALASDVPIMPAHVLQEVPPDRVASHDFHRDPLVDGPWRVATWERGARLVLEPNPAWSGPAEDAARLARVVFRVVPDEAVRLMELKAGDVDMLPSLPLRSVDELVRHHPEIRILERGWRGLYFLAYNQVDPGESSPEDRVPHPLFGERAVRRALTTAVDRDRIIRDLFPSETLDRPLARDATGTLSPSLCGLDDPALGIIPHDTAEAAQALTDAGWVDHDGDGWRDRAGQTFRFDVLVRAGEALHRDVAVLVQGDLKDVGVDMEIVPLGRDEWQKRAGGGHFDAILYGFEIGLVPNPGLFWHSGEFGHFNLSHYRNPEVDRAIEAFHAEPGWEAAREHLRTVQRQVYADQPWTFLLWTRGLAAIHRRFQDVGTDEVSPWAALEQWWVPADQVRYSQ